MPKGLLEGKTGVILGVANARSIAWACAKAFQEHGATLIFNYLPEPLEKRVRKLLASDMPDALAYQCDVSKDEEITSFFENVRKHTDKIDFVIHSLAYAERDDLNNPFIQTPRKNFALALDISAYSLVAIAREAEPMMSEGGSIVTMTYLGAERVVPNYNVMGVAKAALESSARYLAHELGPKGVRVNCISAGPLKTLAASAISGMRSINKLIEEGAPLRRNIDTSDVGKTALYLVSDLASGVTGQTIYVDAGYSAMGVPVLPE